VPTSPFFPLRQGSASSVTPGLTSASRCHSRQAGRLQRRQVTTQQPDRRQPPWRSRAAPPRSAQPAHDGDRLRARSRGRRLVLVTLASLLTLGAQRVRVRQGSPGPPAPADNNGEPTVTIQDLAHARNSHGPGRNHGHLGLARRRHRSLRAGRRLPEQGPVRGDLQRPLRPARHLRVHLLAAPHPHTTTMSRQPQPVPRRQLTTSRSTTPVVKAEARQRQGRRTGSRGRLPRETSQGRRGTARGRLVRGTAR
jgi:hypothetical protein